MYNYHVLHVLAFIVSVLCLCMAYNSEIILAKVVTYDLLFLKLCRHIRHKPTKQVESKLR